MGGLVLHPVLPLLLSIASSGLCFGPNFGSGFNSIGVNPSNQAFNQINNIASQAANAFQDGMNSMGGNMNSLPRGIGFQTNSAAPGMTRINGIQNSASAMFQNTANQAQNAANQQLLRPNMNPQSPAMGVGANNQLGVNGQGLAAAVQVGNQVGLGFQSQHNLLNGLAIQQGIPSVNRIAQQMAPNNVPNQQLNPFLPPTNNMQLNNNLLQNPFQTANNAFKNAFNSINTAFANGMNAVNGMGNRPIGFGFGAVNTVQFPNPSGIVGAPLGINRIPNPAAISNPQFGPVPPNMNVAAGAATANQQMFNNQFGPRMPFFAGPAGAPPALNNAIVNPAQYIPLRPTISGLVPIPAGSPVRCQCAASHPANSHLSVNVSLPPSHPNVNASLSSLTTPSVPATNASVSHIHDTVGSLSSMAKTLTDKAAILSDDGTTLRNYLVKVNSTDELLAKWDSTIKDKGESGRLNLTSFAKKDPFCACSAATTCNCCISADLSVIKKDVCLEASIPKPGNGTMFAILIDHQRQAIPLTSDLKKGVFAVEGLGQGEVEIDRNSSSPSSQFCVAAALQLLGVKFPALPLGCFTATNDTIHFDTS